LAIDNKTQEIPEKKIEKVTTGKVTIKKKSAFAKIKELFISEDSDKVGSYILMDVLVPSIKRAIVDIIKSSADMIFGTKGSSPSPSSKITFGGTPYVNYAYTSSTRKPDPVNVARSQYEVGDFNFETRADAEEVLSSLEAIIEAYGKASVADLCDLVGAPYEYVANKYGWKNLHDAVAIRTSSGYSLRLPKSIPLE